MKKINKFKKNFTVLNLFFMFVLLFFVCINIYVFWKTSLTTHTTPLAANAATVIPWKEWSLYKALGYFKLYYPTTVYQLTKEPTSDRFPNQADTDSVNLIPTGKTNTPYEIQIAALNNVNNLDYTDPQKLFEDIPNGCEDDAIQAYTVGISNIRGFRKDNCSEGKPGVASQILMVKGDTIFEIILTRDEQTARDQNIAEIVLQNIRILK